MSSGTDYNYDDDTPSCNCKSIHDYTIKELEDILSERMRTVKQRQEQLKEAKEKLEKATREVSRLEYDVAYLEGKQK